MLYPSHRPPPGSHSVEKRPSESKAQERHGGIVLAGMSLYNGSMTSLDGIDVLVLAGGLGTRIRGVLGDTPKVLAPINGRPFLDHLLDSLALSGAGRVVLALGHLADTVRDHLAAGPLHLPVLSVVEEAPLGTAGAVRLAMPSLSGDPVMVMNGDTWLDTDLGALMAAHRQRGCLVSLLCVPVDDVSRYGSVETAADGSLRRFVEKDPDRAGPGLVYGGIALLSGKAMGLLALGEGPSLERDFFATLPPGAVHVHVADKASFIDIGTPESLRAADAVLPNRNLP